MAFYREQSAAAQTAYANLAQAARQHELNRSIADIPGSFVKKTIKGKDYWYYQHKLPGGTPQQTYVGPDDEETRALMASNADPAAKNASRHLAQLSEAAMALGCSGVIPKHARVLIRLADHGLFKAGGILVGTHAYLSYQNRFGVTWGGGDTTMDLDFAHPGRNISLAYDPSIKVDMHEAIDSLKMGFLPVNSGTRYVKSDEPDFDLDFLTSLHRGGQEPIESKALNVTLQPLKFMEFSMVDPVSAVLPTANGPIMVNVPRPERYALAKLLVYMERLESKHAEKASKDLLQAATLIDYLTAERPDDLREAWEDLVSRGKGWTSRAGEALKAMREKFPHARCISEMAATDEESAASSSRRAPAARRVRL
ncbi:hypothetical protein ABIC83_002807 [Roseateles asaccharophilus]|uniref:GSU2403 family nucleotidyltransferase fold protein n=1 Tax=Roseateles asaccharophilus TaxID=582607 RepID=UPI0038342D2F